MYTLIYLHLVTLLLYVLPSLSDTYCRHENNITITCNYFPRNIPIGISRVTIQDFMKDGVDLVIDQSFFLTKHWNFVKYLELKDNSLLGTLKFNASSFNQLQMLSEINLRLEAIFMMSDDVFKGTKSVRVLNMGDCVRLCMSDFVQSLNGTYKLPNLEVLNISRLGAYCKPLVIDLNFGQILHSKRIKDLVISTTQISYFDLETIAYVKSLEKLNLSNSQIGHVDGGNQLNVSDLVSIKVLDFSHLDLPKSLMPPPGKYVITSSDVADGKVISVLNALIPQSVNLTSIASRAISIWIMNYTFHINEPLHTSTRELVIKQNNLKYLDLQCINNSISSIKELDISGNELEFISPFVSSCFPGIKKIYLSDNQLFKMAKQHFTLFSKFSKSFRNLQILSFSGNNLQTIPYNMFENCSKLEEIDLSHNNLQQVTFSLEQLKNLKILNLGRNSIHILNDISINRLNSLPLPAGRDKNYAVVILTPNNISCSTCDAKHFIEWILKTNYINITSQDLKCLDDDGRKTYITTKTVKHLKYLCHLVTYIILSCSFVMIFVIIVFAFAFKMYRRRLLIKQREHRYNVIERFRGGLSQYKHACYLVYSLEDTINEDSDDEQESLAANGDIMTRDFVENNFLAPLETNLEYEIEAGRQLVCFDEEADGGRSDFNVFFNNLASSSTVVVIASQMFFSNALYCWMLEQVIAQGKRILFLIKDGVTYSFMTEETKRIFKNSKMFKWKVEDGEIVLKSSWREVCTSILDITNLSESNAE